LFQSALYRSYLVLKTTFELAYNFFCYTSQLHPLLHRQHVTRLFNAVSDATLVFC